MRGYIYIHLKLLYGWFSKIIIIKDLIWLTYEFYFILLLIQIHTILIEKKGISYTLMEIDTTLKFINIYRYLSNNNNNNKKIILVL